jgi:aspartate carbamoyltransferase catalytic subunit
VEISGGAVLSESSLIPEQVASGIAVRQAVLALSTGVAETIAA